MKIILTQSEIEAAIKAHVGGLVSVREGTEIGISFAATRGEDRIVATIDINYVGTTTIPEIINTQPSKVTTIAVGDVVKETPAPRAKPGPKPKANLFGATNPETPAKDPAADPDPGLNDDPVDTAVTNIVEAVDANPADKEAAPTKEEEEAAPTTVKKSLFS